MKRLGFSLEEIKRMSWLQATFWMECIAYDAELMAEAAQPQKEVHSLDELAKILPKTEE